MQILVNEEDADADKALKSTGAFAMLIMCKIIQVIFLMFLQYNQYIAHKTITVINMKARALKENGDRQKTHCWQVISCCIDTMVILVAIFLRHSKKWTSKYTLFSSPFLGLQLCGLLVTRHVVLVGFS